MLKIVFLELHLKNFLLRKEPKFYAHFINKINSNLYN